MSQCLSVFVLGKVRGVVCADMKVDTFFSEIVDFRLGQLSYSFFVDSRSRILIHPLLPRPEIYYKEPIFLDMESVEISNETRKIKEAMLRQVNTNHLRWLQCMYVTHILTVLVGLSSIAIIIYYYF